MLVLGIETSCDESGVAIYDTDAGLLAHTLYSQVDLHAEYGGVVPELASRDHVRKLLPLVDQALLAAGRKLSDIQGIAYTGGPGLIGALLVGAAVARAMAWRLDVPALAVNHMEGHLLAAMLDDPRPEYPFVCLLVSGGHTQLFDVKAPGSYELLGESLDDAAGEAFDKTAKMLGLGYPGGPALAKLAELGNIERFQFPRPMTDRPGLDFSFSGLKTHAITAWRAAEQNQQTRADIAIAFQSAAVETLLIKSRRALRQTGCPRLVVAGGVGANQHLRLRFTETFSDDDQQVYYPRLEFCTDNGAMIAYAGALRLLAGEADRGTLLAKPRWRLDDLTAIGG